MIYRKPRSQRAIRNPGVCWLTQSNHTPVVYFGTEYGGRPIYDLPSARVGLRTLKAHRNCAHLKFTFQWRPLGVQLAPQYLTDHIASLGIYDWEEE
jgi:hypothetical protein